MAAEQLLPQPIIFNRTNDCNCPNSADQDRVLIGQGDIMQWQLSNAPCADAINQYFVDGTVGTWTITGDEYCHTAGAPGVIAGTSILQDNQPYQIIVDVTFPTDPENGTVQVIIGNIVLGDITKPGRYFFYYNNTIPGDNRIAIGVTSDFDGCIDRVQVLPFNQMWRVLAKDLDGNIIASYDESTKFWFIQNRFITFRVDLQDEGVVDGCYTFCMADPCVNTCSQNRLIGQDFRDNTIWDLVVSGGGVLVIDPSTGMLQWGVSGAGDTGSARRADTLCDGISYEITFTLSSVVNAMVQVNIGGTLGTARATNGTFTETITSAGANFSMNFAGTGAGSLAQVTDFTLKAIDADIAPDFTSEKILLETDVACSKLLNWCNDKNEDFGQGWELTNFSPNIRLKLRAYQPDLNIEERKAIEGSNGRKYNDYVRARFNRRLVTDYIPDYQIEAIMLGLLSDHFYVDGIEKFLEGDEIITAWSPDNTNMGTLEATIGDQTQLYENKRCTAEENPCPEILGANFKSGLFLLILGDGSTLNIYK